MKRVLFSFVLALIVAARLIPAMAAEHSAELWHVTHVTDPASGKFNYCAVESGFDNGLYLAFARNRDFNTNIVVSFPDKRLQDHSKYKMLVAIDANPVREMTGFAADPTILVIPLQHDRKIIEWLQKGKLLDLKGPQDSVKFALDGAGDALHKLQLCVEKSLKEETVRGATPSHVTPNAADVSEVASAGDTSLEPLPLPQVKQPDAGSPASTAPAPEAPHPAQPLADAAISRPVKPPVEGVVASAPVASEAPAPHPEPVPEVSEAQTKAPAVAPQKSPVVIPEPEPTDTKVAADTKADIASQPVPAKTVPVEAEAPPPPAAAPPAAVAQVSPVQPAPPQVSPPASIPAAAPPSAPAVAASAEPPKSVMISPAPPTSPVLDAIASPAPQASLPAAPEPAPRKPVDLSVTALLAASGLHPTGKCTDKSVTCSWSDGSVLGSVTQARAADSFLDAMMDDTDRHEKKCKGQFNSALAAPVQRDGLTVAEATFECNQDSAHISEVMLYLQGSGKLIAITESAPVANQESALKLRNQIETALPLATNYQ